MHAVRCPNCQNLSRVGADALGRTVACPHCGRPFPATPEPPAPVLRARPVEPAPLVRPRRPRTAPPPTADDIPVVRPTRDSVMGLVLEGDRPPGLTPTFLALVLMPLGIPLLWLAGPLLTGRTPIFSFAAPVALALCLCGLSLGIGFAHGWSAGTRVRAALALLVVGYATGGFLYFIKKEWAEAVRRHVGPGDLEWKDFQPPDRAYKVKLPGQAVGGPQDDKPLPGWALQAFRFARDRKAPQDPLSVRYEVAHGTPPADVAGPKLKDGDWFDKAKEAAARGCDGEVVRERPVAQKDHPGREYVFTLPDGATNRIVRVFRVRDKAFYLAVEGAFVPDDAQYVKTFFDSFLVAPR